MYKKFRIKRSKRPNILNVELEGVCYEDAEAQVIINKYFGANSSMFFMDLPNAEKLEFLEKVVNSDCNVKDLKIKIKKSLSELNNQLAVLDAKIESTQSMIEIIDKPNKIEKPCKDLFFEIGIQIGKEELVDGKREVSARLQGLYAAKVAHDSLVGEISFVSGEIDSIGLGNASARLNESCKFVAELRENLEGLKEKNKKFHCLKSLCLMVEKDLKELNNYDSYKEEDLAVLKEEIEMLNKDIKDHVDRANLTQFYALEREYQSLLQQEQDEWRRETQFLERELETLECVENVNLADIQHQYRILKDALDFNSKQNLKKIYDDIQSIKKIFYKSYKCPKCEHKIVVNMDTSEMVKNADVDASEMMNGYEDSRNRDYVSAKKKLEKLVALKEKVEHNLSIVSDANITSLEENISLAKRRDKVVADLSRINRFKPSFVLLKMEKEVNKLKPSMTQVDAVSSGEEDPLITLEALKDRKRDVSISLNTLADKLKTKANLLNKIKSVEKYDEKEHLVVEHSIQEQEDLLKQKCVELEKLKNKERLECKIKKLKKELDDLDFDERLILESEDRLKKLDMGLKYHECYSEYKHFQQQLKKYKTVKQTLADLKTDRRVLEQKYLKMLLFKQKVIEAEHDSLQFIVDIVNTHLGILLRDFFSENFGDPIQIYLELAHENTGKTRRSQINTVINYKGNLVDYKSLSTGEYARVKLAFDLTFKEILGENIIMLDECTANLDQDLSTKILEKIRETFPSKTVLVVAHQAVTGTFDNVIHVYRN